MLHFVSNSVSDACLTVLFLCEQSSVLIICFTPDAVACCKSCISTPETQRVSINSVSTKHFVYTTTPLKPQTRPSLVSIKFGHFPYSHTCTLLQNLHPSTSISIFSQSHTWHLAVIGGSTNGDRSCLHHFTYTLSARIIFVVFVNAQK
jgi:hypothetical protein